MKTLSDIWFSLPDKSDKGSVHSYLPVYEKLLEPYRHKALNVLEIGLFNGASLIMWEKYFTQAKVQGIDCSETPHDGMADLRPMIKSGNYNIHIFDAEDVTEVSRRFFGVKFDVIIEDAGHHIEQQVKLYSIWKEYLASDGVYIIEDVQDIDKDKYLFAWAEILDRRKIKNRYDDVLIIIK